MSSIVHEIVAAFGGTAKTAAATGFPMKMVSDWKRRKPSIPPWRRAAVLSAAQTRRIQLPPHALAYLASNDRNPPVLA